MARKFTLCSKQFHVLTFALLLSFSSFAQFTSYNTIFHDNDAPASPLRNDGQPIEIGVKFRATQNGYIAGIRFYKGAGTSGTHIGQLWSSTGILLAAATFTNETASGWQQVLFGSPFAISSGTTYVAACFSSSGDYAVTNNGFSSPVVNGPLHALSNSEPGGPNGLYDFTIAPAFPVSSFNANNYWVDVLLATNAVPDVLAPVVISVSPSNRATNVSLNTTIKVAFNESINPSTVSNSQFELHDANGTLIPAAVSYLADSNTIILKPSSSLTMSTVYTATIKGGSPGIKDMAGNGLTADYSWSFTAADPAFIAPASGYGGPILIVSSGSNPFSQYAAEILRAEGLTEFAVKDISTLNEPDIDNNYDVIILGDMEVSASQVTMLTNWIGRGGTLIAFKPSLSLTSLLGLSASGGTLTDKYLLVNTESGPGTGIVNQTIQFHGDANLYTLDGATSIATLYSDANTRTNYPAVTTKDIGNRGGKAIAFAYDLARSVVYTRQGNPAWAGQKRDTSIAPIRSDNLFYPNWIDFNKIAIPQADEQQRLLANIILQSDLHRRPLPRLWYLPKGLKAAIVLTGDDHATNGTTGRFNYYLTLGSNKPEDVANWNTIRATSYVFADTPITNIQAKAFEQAGFEIAFHPTTICSDFTPESLENTIANGLRSFANVFPGVSAPVTNRTHCVPWSDWASHAKVEAKHGLKLDVNYYYWPAYWVQNRPGLFTGSGLPMRFADKDGTLIDCYQAPTQMTDESGIDIGAFCNAILDKATGPEGYYGTFVANMHTDFANHAGANAIIASAMTHKVPVISAKQLLTWIDGRNNSFYRYIVWNSNHLNFQLSVPSGANNLNVMLPLYSEKGKLYSITRNDETVQFTTEVIKGMSYAFFDAHTGTANYVANYSVDGTQGTPLPEPNLDVKVLPNPTETYFTLVINSDNSAPIGIEISDMLGRVVEKYKRTGPNTVLQIGQTWSTGIYLARIIHGDQEKVVRMLKTK